MVDIRPLRQYRTIWASLSAGPPALVGLVAEDKGIGLLDLASRKDMG
jgi:hypothetical protein